MQNNSLKEYVLFGSRALALLCKHYLNIEYPLSEFTDWDFVGISPDRPNIPISSHYINILTEKEPLHVEAKKLINRYGLYEEIDGWKVCEPRLLFLSWLTRIALGFSPKIICDIHKFILIREILKVKHQWGHFQRRINTIVKKYDLCFDHTDWYLNQMGHFAKTDIILVGQCAYKLYCLATHEQHVPIEDLTIFTTSDNQYSNSRCGGSIVKTWAVENPRYILQRRIKILDPYYHLDAYKQLLTEAQFNHLKKLISHVEIVERNCNKE